MAQSKAARPQLRPGDSWTYRTTDVNTGKTTQTYRLKILEVQGDRVEVERTSWSPDDPDGKPRVNRARADTTTWTFDNRNVLEGRIVAFQFPIEIGRTWEYSYRWRNTEGEPTNFQIAARVEDWQEAAVPAGTFRTAQIVHALKWTREVSGKPRNGIGERVYWYAPGIERLVRFESKMYRSDGRLDRWQRTELMSYELKD